MPEGRFRRLRVLVEVPRCGHECDDDRVTPADQPDVLWSDRAPRMFEVAARELDRREDHARAAELRRLFAAGERVAALELVELYLIPELIWDELLWGHS